MEHKGDFEENRNPDFIKEIVKEKDIKKDFFKRLIPTVLIVAIAAAVGAFVFAFTLPFAKDLAGADSTENSKISIPDDESTQDTSSADTDVASVSETAETSQESVHEETADDAEYVYTIDDYKKLNSDIKEVAESAQHSIVTVTGITSQKDYFNQTYESQQKLSGFIVGKNDSSLFIVTEYSILENVEKIQVEFTDGYLADGSFQRNDINTGLAVIRVDLGNIPETTKEKIEVAQLGNSLEVLKGDPVIALGSPLGYSDYISYGMITSVSNTISVYDAEYTVFTTNISGSQEGNGIILNLDGKVIGIIISGGNDVSAGTINAYSVSQIKNVIEKLSNNEVRPFVGIKGVNVSTQTAERIGLPSGVLITGVKEDSPAMLAGLMENDVIVGIDDTNIGNMNGYSVALRQYSPGDKVVIRAMRKGSEGYKEIEFNIELGEI